MQFADNGVHCFFQLSIAIAEIVHRIRVNVVTFNDGIHMWLHLATKESLVILASFHHNREVCKLCRTVVNIQSINIILYDARNCSSCIYTISLINLYKHIKHINQNVAAAGTRVDAQNILWFQGFVLFTNRSKLSLNIWFLLCLFQIVFPLRFQLIVWMTFHPQTTKAVFHHVANNPVRCKKLGCCWNIFLRDFYVLLKGGKYVVLLFAVIVLI